MNLPLPDLSAKISGASCSVVGFVAAVFVVVNLLARPSKLDPIPTIGLGSWPGSWWTGWKFLVNSKDVMREGYEKHKSAFKVATLYYWIVFLNSRENVEEVRKAPEDVLSFTDAINERLQLEYTMEPEIVHNPYHISIVRSQLTRNIGTLYPEIRNEMTMAFDDVLALTGNEWKGVLALKSMQEVVCRTTNRVLVGLPLCRDPEWTDLNIRYTIDVFMGGLIIGLFPKVLKPIATRLFTKVHRDKHQGRKLLRPIIEERRKHLNEYGEKWADKPNDFLSWAMDEGQDLTIESLTARMLTVNFAAIHTSSNSFTHALLYLAANPQYTQPLREEVESIVANEGWSKAALAKMHKIDSFLRECQRIEGISGLSIMRMAKKDLTLSDGTFLPQGTMISVAAECFHHDEKFYENPDVFEPFRFTNMHEQDGEGRRYQLVSTSAEYLPFGYGKQACPGRFFVANEMKTMLAHIVTVYDVKLEDGATHPRSLRLSTSNTPDPRARVLFRKRVD